MQCNARGAQWMRTGQTFTKQSPSWWAAKAVRKCENICETSVRILDSIRIMIWRWQRMQHVALAMSVLEANYQPFSSQPHLEITCHIRRCPAHFGADGFPDHWLPTRDGHSPKVRKQTDNRFLNWLWLSSFHSCPIAEKSSEAYSTVWMLIYLWEGLRYWEGKYFSEGDWSWPSPNPHKWLYGIHGEPEVMTTLDKVNKLSTVPEPGPQDLAPQSPLCFVGGISRSGRLTAAFRMIDTPLLFLCTPNINLHGPNNARFCSRRSRNAIKRKHGTSSCEKLKGIYLVHLICYVWHTRKMLTAVYRSQRL